MRHFALALALLCVPALALAQSDSRKVALFKLNGNNTTNTLKQGPPIDTYGISTSADDYQVTYSVVRQMLERMGVPFDEFNCADSTDGWARNMGSKRGATADSTWFRQQGYMGLIFCVPGVLTSQTLEPVTFFTSQGVKAAQAASPLGGTWGIPTICFMTVGRSYAAAGGYRNGVKDSTMVSMFKCDDSTAWVSSTFIDNGDTIPFAYGYARIRSNAQIDSVSVIWKQAYKRGEPADTAGVPTDSVAMRAWKWKTSTYYYPTATNDNYVPVFLGLAKLFDVAGYEPRRKINVHFTNDHIFPVDTYRMAASDSMMAYLQANRWRFKGGVQWTGQDTHPDTTVKAAWLAYKDYFALLPHSHGTLTIGGNWNLTAADYDSALYASRWNAMLRAVQDTLGLGTARGFERVLETPLSNLKYPLLHVYLTDGVTDMRANYTDSIGSNYASLTARNLVVAGRARSPSKREFLDGRPRPFQDPKSGKLIWIHGCLGWIAPADTSWASNTAFGFEATSYGYAASFLGYVSRMALADGDLFFHSDDNLKGAWTGMALQMRYLTYFANRCKRILTVQPYYQPQVPRRHNTPKPG